MATTTSPIIYDAPPPPYVSKAEPASYYPSMPNPGPAQVNYFPQVDDAAESPPVQHFMRFGDLFLWWLALGLLGGHHFAVRNYKWGFLYLFTGGLFGCGWLFDFFRLPQILSNYNYGVQYTRYHLHEAYCLALNPVAFLGAHHFYLGDYLTGTLYFFTFGFFGLGPFYDVFFLPCLVRMKNGLSVDGMSDKVTIDAGRLNYNPVMGLVFGGGHYALGNYKWGILCTLTCSLFGLGWLVDLVRFPWLIARWRHTEAARQELYLDDAYILLVGPGGFLGLHHFYLGRPVYGLLYLCTGGVFGLGWLLDLVRLPSLVRDARLEGKIPWSLYGHLQAATPLK